MTRAAVHLLVPGEGPARSAFSAALQDRAGPALQFLASPPTDAAAWAAHMQQALTGAPACPPEVVSSLRALHARLGGGERAAAHLDALEAGDPVMFVVTGQQPGLLGGPLLTAHKIAGAIHLANALDGIGGIRVAPLYWAATEDHDFDEANRATVLDRSGTPRVLQVAGQNDGRSIGHRMFAPDELDAVWRALAEALPDTERGHEALALARREPDDDFAAWSLRCVVRLFGDSGLLVADPLLFQVPAAPTYDLLLKHGRAIDDSMRASAQALRAHDLPAPLSFDEGTAPLFVREEVAGPRLRVRIDSDGSVRLREKPHGDLAALRQRVRETPKLASGNVAGRVFVQNALFPVLAYVAGPTEIAYQAQVRAAHAVCGLAFPLALPRPHATWVDTKTARRAAGFGLSLEELLREVPAAAPTAPAVDVAASVEAHLASWPAPVLDALARSGAGPEALRRALERVRGTWAKAASRVRAGFDADVGRGPAQWARMMDVLHPRNRPQDRVLSPLSLVARHGVASIREGLLKLDPLRAGHYLVHPEGPPDV